jgi:hypothetical protein
MIVVAVADAVCAVAVADAVFVVVVADAVLRCSRRQTVAVTVGEVVAVAVVFRSGGESV